MAAALPMGKAGIEPAMFTTWVADLQSAAIAAMLTCPNAFPVYNRLPGTSKVYCEPQTAGTQNWLRALPADLAFSAGLWYNIDVPTIS